MGRSANLTDLALPVGVTEPSVRVELPLALEADEFLRRGGVFITDDVDLEQLTTSGALSPGKNVGDDRPKTSSSAPGKRGTVKGGVDGREPSDASANSVASKEVCQDIDDDLKKETGGASLVESDCDGLAFNDAGRADFAFGRKMEDQRGGMP